MRFDLGPDYLKTLAKHRPVAKDDPRRAVDFQKCVDPKCGLHLAWQDFIKRFPSRADDVRAHCHPTF